jgi:hypothetical protein
VPPPKASGTVASLTTAEVELRLDLLTRQLADRVAWRDCHDMKSVTFGVTVNVTPSSLQ